MDDEVSRRTYLNAILATGVTGGIAGCNSVQNNSDPESASENPIATPNEAPQLRAHDAKPEENGTSLAVSLEGEDDHGLSLARIEYGDKSVEKNPETASVTLDDEFTNIGESTLDTTPGQATFLLRDTDGNETRAAVNPDETAPELRAFAVEPTSTAGQIVAQLAGQDETGLEEIRVRIGGQSPVHKSVSGQQSHTINQRVSVQGDATFQQQTVTGSLADWNGNTTTSEAEVYVRKYDAMEDPSLDIGVDYMVFIGNALNNCIESGVDVEPAVGRYGGRAPYHPVSGETVCKHIDQMSGHGIGRLTPTFDGTYQDREQLESVLDADLIDQIEVQGKYGVKEYRWLEDPGDSFKDDIIPEDFGFLRETVLERENVSRQDGRPVLKVWNPGFWVGNDELYNQLSNEYDDWPAMLSDVRSHLEVDGTTPYLIAGTFAGGHREGWRWRRTDQLISEFDAVTTWTASSIWGDDGRTTWEEVVPWVEENFEGLREFTDSHDMDFIPTVFPGFDDRANECWGEDRYTPRSKEGFERLLELADEYRTTERVDIATWNDWTEGSQIEPGSFRETDYGTEYLEIVEEFQKAN